MFYVNTRYFFLPRPLRRAQRPSAVVKEQEVEALKKNKQSERISRDKKDGFLKQSLLDVYKDKIRARPT